MSIVEHSPLTRSRLHRNARGPESQHKLIAEMTHMAVGCHNPTSASCLVRTIGLRIVQATWKGTAVLGT